MLSVVVRSMRRSPRGLLQYVRDERRKDQDWDEIYCVFDHDGRDRKISEFSNGLADLDQAGDTARVEMTLSDPCFELWLLLHFEYTDRPFHNVSGGKTAAQQVTEHLRRYLPGYEKNDPKTFERCHKRMHDAIRNAKRLAESHDIPDAPRTDVGSLVERLLQVSRNGEA